MTFTSMRFKWSLQSLRYLIDLWMEFAFFIERCFKLLKLGLFLVQRFIKKTVNFFFLSFKLSLFTDKLR